MASKTLAERLTDLKKKIEESKAEVARCEGSKDTLLKRLKDEHGVSTIQAGETLLKKLQRDITRDEQVLEKELSAVEEALNA